MRPRGSATIPLLACILMIFLLEVMQGVPWVAVDGDGLQILYRMGAITSTLFELGEYWRLFAAMFLHIGLLHLLLNGWALVQLGSVFETLFGRTRFLVTYFISGLAASIVSAAFLEPGTIAAGASGAIFGTLGALILGIRRSRRWRGEPWARGLTQQLIGWSVFNIVIGFSFPAIDNRAHIGGFVAGLLLGLFPHRVPPPPPNQIVIDTTPRG